MRWVWKNTVEALKIVVFCAILSNRKCISAKASDNGYAKLGKDEIERNIIEGDDSTYPPSPGVSVFRKFYVEAFDAILTTHVF